MASGGAKRDALDEKSIKARAVTPSAFDAMLLSEIEHCLSSKGPDAACMVLLRKRGAKFESRLYAIALEHVLSVAVDAPPSSEIRRVAYEIAQKVAGVFEIKYTARFVGLWCSLGNLDEAARILGRYDVKCEGRGARAALKAACNVASDASFDARAIILEWGSRAGMLEGFRVPVEVVCKWARSGEHLKEVTRAVLEGAVDDADIIAGAVAGSVLVDDKGVSEVGEALLERVTDREVVLRKIGSVLDRVPIDAILATGVLVEAARVGGVLESVVCRGVREHGGKVGAIEEAGIVLKEDESMLARLAGGDDVPLKCLVSGEGEWTETGQLVAECAGSWERLDARGTKSGVAIVGEDGQLTGFGRRHEWTDADVLKTPVNRLVTDSSMTAGGEEAVRRGLMVALVKRVPGNTLAAIDELVDGMIGGGDDLVRSKVGEMDSAVFVREGNLTDLALKLCREGYGADVAGRIEGKDVVDEAGRMGDAAKLVLADQSMVQVLQLIQLERMVLPNGQLTELGRWIDEAGPDARKMVRDRIDSNILVANDDVTPAGRLLLRDGGWAANGSRFPVADLVRDGSFTAVGQEVWDAVGEPAFADRVSRQDVIADGGRLTAVGQAMRNNISLLHHCHISDLLQGPNVTQVGEAVRAHLPNSRSNQVRLQTELQASAGILRTDSLQTAEKSPSAAVSFVVETGLVSPSLVSNRLEEWTPALIYRDPDSMVQVEELSAVGKLLVLPLLSSLTPNNLVPAFVSPTGVPTRVCRAIVRMEDGARTLLKTAVAASTTESNLLLSTVDDYRPTEFAIVVQSTIGEREVAESLALTPTLKDLPARAYAHFPQLLAATLDESSDRHELAIQVVNDESLNGEQLEDAIVNLVRADPNLTNAIVREKGLFAVAALAHVGVQVHPSEAINRFGLWAFFAALSVFSVASDIWFCIKLFIEADEAQAHSKVILLLAISSVTCLGLTFVANFFVTRWFIQRAATECMDVGCPHFPDILLWGESRIVSSIIIASCVATPEAGTLLYGNLAPPLSIATLKAWSWPAAVLEDLTHTVIQVVAFIYGGPGGASLYFATATTFLQLAFRAARAMVVGCIGRRAPTSNNAASHIQHSASFMDGDAKAPLLSESSDVELTIQHREQAPHQENSRKNLGVVDPWEMANAGASQRLSTRSVVFVFSAGAIPLVLMGFPNFFLLGLSGSKSLDLVGTGFNDVFGWILALFLIGLIARSILVTITLQRIQDRKYIIDAFLQPETHGVAVMGAILGDATLLSALQDSGVIDGAIGSSRRQLGVAERVLRLFCLVLSIVFFSVCAAGATSDQSGESVTAQVGLSIVGFLGCLVCSVGLLSAEREVVAVVFWFVVACLRALARQLFTAAVGFRNLWRTTEKQTAAWCCCTFAIACIGPATFFGMLAFTPQQFCFYSVYGSLENSFSVDQELTLDLLGDWVPFDEHGKGDECGGSCMLYRQDFPEYPIPLKLSEDDFSSVNFLAEQVTFPPTVNFEQQCVVMLNATSQDSTESYYELLCRPSTVGLHLNLSMCGNALDLDNIINLNASSLFQLDTPAVPRSFRGHELGIEIALIIIAALGCTCSGCYALGIHEFQEYSPRSCGVDHGAERVCRIGAILMSTVVWFLSFPVTLGLSYLSIWQNATTGFILFGSMCAVLLLGVWLQSNPKCKRNAVCAFVIAYLLCCTVAIFAVLDSVGFLLYSPAIGAAMLFYSVVPITAPCAGYVARSFKVFQPEEKVREVYYVGGL